MTWVKVECGSCGAQVEKLLGEVNRAQKLGRRLFCSLQCTARVANAPKKAQEIVSVCLCGTRFVTTTKAKAAKHCSRACASRFSMNEKRREAQRVGGTAQSANLISPAEALKRREAWKYSILRETLRERPHEFEFELGGCVFDLALHDTKVLVEFDGPYHTGEQLQTDVRKDKVATVLGYVVVRRSVLAATVIDPATLAGL